jgi:hypothetical protein
MFAACSLLLALAAVSPAVGSTAATSSSLILGRVVDADTGRPIAGAIVTLFGSAASTHPARVMTNASGQFVARGLRQGTLFFVVTKGGYVDATFGQRRPGGSAQPLPIGEGQRLTNIDIRMWRHAAIAGTVVDEAGEPIVGARVQAYVRSYVAGCPRLLPDRVAATDDRGMYRLAPLMPGSYQVAVVSTQVALPGAVVDAVLQRTTLGGMRAVVSRDAGTIGAAIAPSGTPFTLTAGAAAISLSPGTATARAERDGSLIVYQTTFFPSATSAAQGAIVTVRSGQERAGVDVQMWPARARRVSGTILSPLGVGDHVVVRLVPAGEDLLPELEAAATMSDAAGAYTFPAVPPGSYVLQILRTPRSPEADEDGSRVTIVRTGAVSVSSSAVPLGPPAPPPPIPADATLCARVAVGVGDTDLTGLAVPLRPAPRVSGRVEFDGSGERPDATTLANVRIVLDPADGSPLPEGLGHVTGRIDATGQFTTFGVPPGRYLIRTSGLSDWFFKGALFEGRDVADTPIDLGYADASGVVILFTDRASGIAGIVRDRQRPDGGAVVLAFPTDETQWSAAGSQPWRIRTARASDDGTYLFPVLPPGEYFVIALHEDVMETYQDPEFLRSVSRAATRVQVIEGERRTQDLRTVTLK